MAFTIGFFAFLIGAAISLRCNILILIATIGGAILGATIVGIAHGSSMGSVVLIVVIVATAPQIGFLLGILGRGVIGAGRQRIAVHHLSARA